MPILDLSLGLAFSCITRAGNIFLLRSRDHKTILQIRSLDEASFATVWQTLFGLRPTCASNGEHPLEFWSAVGIVNKISFSALFSADRGFWNENAKIRSRRERMHRYINPVVRCCPTAAKINWLFEMAENFPTDLAMKPDPWSARMSQETACSALWFLKNSLVTAAIFLVVVWIDGNFESLSMQLIKFL